MGILLILIILCQLLSCVAVHIKGTWNSDERVHMVAKFGVRQMDALYKETTKGYIYGNVTIGDSPNTIINESS